MFRHSNAPSGHRALASLVLASLIAFAPLAEAGRVRNNPPVISGSPTTTVTVATAYAFQPTASDADGNRLTFKISGKPVWATFSSATGRLSGTPGTAGTYSSISIKVTDGKATVALPTFAITVKTAVTAPVNTPPTISGAPATSVLASSNYLFRPTAADANGDALTFSIVGKPAWATFEASTGTLYGTPLVIDAGTYGSITISVSDGKAAASLAPFAITVTAPATNRAPTISGSAVTSGQVDRPYAFQPTAADADSDTLTFSIVNKPSWATFDSSNGTLYGTPTAANVGTYSNITISVSDGKASASLGAFAINVAAAPTKSVTLNWTAPTMNTDGSALTNLAGYIVSYGTASRSYSTTLQLTGAGMNSVVLEGFAPGTYYFTIKSTNNAGVESDYSGEVVAQL